MVSTPIGDGKLYCITVQYCMAEYPKWSPRRDLSPDHSKPAAAVRSFSFEFQVLTDVNLRHVIIQANSARRKLSRKVIFIRYHVGYSCRGTVQYGMLGLGGTGDTAPQLYIKRIQYSLWRRAVVPMAASAPCKCGDIARRCLRAGNRLPYEVVIRWALGRD